MRPLTRAWLLVPIVAWLVSCREPDPETGEPSAQRGGVAPSVAPAPEELPSPVAVPSERAAQEPAPTRAARRGLWIWEFGKRAPAPERAAELASEWGVGRVFIKGGNGNERRRWAHNARVEHLEPFLRRGIEVWIFGYFYAPDVADADGRTWGTLEEQVDATLRTVLVPGVKGLVVDAEEEFKDRAADAERLCKLLRARLEGRSLAYTSYGWIRPNRRFPFATFDAHCGDAFLPQVYYAFGWPGGVDESLRRLEEESRALGLRAPMWPIQSNERDPSPNDMNRFFARTGDDASIFYLHPEGTPQTARLAEVAFRR